MHSYQPRSCRRERLLDTVADPEFARVFFSIWLDPPTRDPQLPARPIGLR